MICWPFYGTRPTTSLRHYFDRPHPRRLSVDNSPNTGNLEVVTSDVSQAVRRGPRSMRTNSRSPSGMRRCPRQEQQDNEESTGRE
jgi:hypothetical protein